MSDNVMSEQELQEIMSELAKAAVTNLQEIFTTAPGGLSWDEVKDRIAHGQSLKDICELTEDYMEHAYQEGMAKMDEADYEGAREIFSTLALYDDRRPRYWAALGKSCEALELYPEALKSYQMLTLVTKGVKPLPYLCMGYCHLALGDRDNAREVLEVGRDLCDPYDEELRGVLDLIEDLLKKCNQ